MCKEEHHARETQYSLAYPQSKACIQMQEPQNISSHGELSGTTIYMKIWGLLSDLCYLAHAAGNGQTEKCAHGHCPHGLTISYICSNYQVE